MHSAGSSSAIAEAAVYFFRQTPLRAAELSWIQARLDAEPDLTLWRQAARICERFGWMRDTGEPPRSATVLLLRRLHRRGLLRLRDEAKARPGGIDLGDAERAQLLAALGTVPGMVECQPTGPLTVRPIAPEERDGYRLHLQRYHYLGFKRSVGESIGYAAFVGEELVALLDWGAAVLQCGPRDRFLGWDHNTRERNLRLVVNNRRFLLLPWIRAKNLASRILGANLRRLRGDWQTRYRHSLQLAETFVDERFRGTCYRASNWQCVGSTRGYSRLRTGFVHHGRAKAVFLYPFSPDAGERLRDTS